MQCRKIYAIDSENGEHIALLPFCEMDSDGSSLHFYNILTQKSAELRVGEYLRAVIMEKLRCGGTYSELSHLLGICQLDGEDVVDRMIKEGFLG